MKILHVTSDWKWTGPAEPMLHAVTGLRERGHACDLACPAEPSGTGPGLLERARERGVEPVEQLSVAQGYRPWRDRDQVLRLRAAIEKGGYDVVHAHHTRDLLLCRAALRGSRARRVVSWHRGEPIPSVLWNRWLWGPGALDGLTVLSPRLRAAAHETLGWPSERVLELPGVVDAKRFAPREANDAVARELGLAREHCVVGIVARLQPHRRFELLLDAVDRARHELPQLRLLVVGRGTRAREVLDEPVAARGLGDVVIRAGYRRDDYLDVLARMRALVFLVPGSDGSCRAVLEAMAMQIPIIATRRGILPDLIENGVTGRLVDETPEALAEAFRELQQDPATWSERGKAARGRILSLHRVEQHAERLDRFYARLLGAES